VKSDVIMAAIDQAMHFPSKSSQKNRTFQNGGTGDAMSQTS
jgi:hypothetical protein